MDYSDNKKVELAKKIYLYLGAIFITSLVVSNLIFQKFFFWHPFELEIFGLKLFELSVGILPYPITFFVTDLISEIYGKKKANEIVIAGIFASFFSLSIIYIANQVPAIDASPVDNETFTQVFEGVPTNSITNEEYNNCYSIEELLKFSPLFKSKSDVIRSLKENSVSINKEKIDSNKDLSSIELIHNKYLVIQRGKKNYSLLLLT